MQADDYTVFSDLDNEADYYCMTKKTLEECNKITAKFGFRETEVPDGYNIKAYRVGRIGEKNEQTNYYDIISNQLIDFPINKIKWVVVRVVGKNTI